MKELIKYEFPVDGKFIQYFVNVETDALEFIVHDAVHFVDHQFTKEERKSNCDLTSKIILTLQDFNLYDKILQLDDSVFIKLLYTTVHNSIGNINEKQVLDRLFILRKAMDIFDVDTYISMMYLHYKELFIQIINDFYKINWDGIVKY